MREGFFNGLLGSVRQQVQTDGTILNEINYDSFGNVVTETNPAEGDRFKFTGREYDDLTALYDYRARWYDANTGKFLSEDPLGFAAGDYNLSRYVGNDPANLVDPSGTEVKLGPYSSWLDSIARDKNRNPVVRILAGMAVGPTAFDTLPVAIKEAFVDARNQVREDIATSNDPVHRFVGRCIVIPSLHAGEAMAQVGNSLGASAPFLAGAELFAPIQTVLAHPVVSNGVRITAVGTAGVNATYQVSQGTFSSSDAVFLALPLVGARADVQRLRRFLSPSPPQTIRQPTPSLFRVRGRISLEEGARPKPSEIRVAESFAEHGYDVTIRLPLSEKGISDVRTSDYHVPGVGRVDVYTPQNYGSKTICRGIEDKGVGDQARIVVVDANLTDAQMHQIVGRFWPKRSSSARNIEVIIFHRDGKLIWFRRPQK